MPISAYVGLTGSGKSYNAVNSVIVPALKSGRKVFTNIPMHNDICLKELGSKVIEFETSDLEKNPNWFTEVFESGSIFVFDECWELWPAGMTASKILQQHKTFIAKHRHDVNEDGFSTEIVFVSQDLTLMATFSTKLIDYTYVSNSLEDLGFPLRTRVDVYKGAYNGTKVSDSKRMREYQVSIKWQKEGDAGRYYVSNTNSQTTGDIQESRSDKRFKVFGAFKYKAMAVGFFALCFGLYSLVNKFYNESQFIQHEDVEIVESDTPTLKPPTEREQLKPSNQQLQSTNIPLDSLPLKNVDELDIVSQVSNIFILGSIEDTYYFKITKADNVDFIDSNDLIALGYRIEPVNDCLVKIHGFNKSHFKYCQDNGNSNDFIRGSSL